MQRGEGKGKGDCDKEKVLRIKGFGTELYRNIYRGGEIYTFS